MHISSQCVDDGGGWVGGWGMYGFVSAKVCPLENGFLAREIEEVTQAYQAQMAAYGELGRLLMAPGHLRSVLAKMYAILWCIGYVCVDVDVCRGKD